MAAFIDDHDNASSLQGLHTLSAGKESLPLVKCLHNITFWTDIYHRALLSLSDESVLAADLDTLARQVFYQKYVHANSDQDIESLWSIDHGNGCLRASAEAVGLIELSRRTPSNTTLGDAECRYVRALQLTNEALRSDEWMGHDSTLLAVNILGIFETLRCNHDDQINGWERHVIGSAALLQNRGPDQFTRSMGGQLFIQNVTNLSWICLWRQERFPDHIYELHSAAQQYVLDPEDGQWMYYCLQLQLVDLYSQRAASGMSHIPADAQRIITSALRLDAQYADLLARDHRNWRYRTLEASGTAVHRGHYHVYTHFHTAQMLNRIRSARILLADLMLRSMAACDTLPASEYMDEVTLARLAEIPTLVAQMQDEILASLPQHVGLDFPTPGDPLARDELWTNFAMADYQTAFQYNHTSAFEIPHLRQNGGYSIHVPIFIAGAADQVANGTVQSFAMTALTALQQSFGVGHAEVLKQRLARYHGVQGYGLGQEKGLLYPPCQ